MNSFDRTETWNRSSPSGSRHQRAGDAPSGEVRREGGRGPESLVRRHPLAATLGAFGIGLGIGAAVGAACAETAFERRRTAESLGRRVLESLERLGRSGLADRIRP